MFQNLTIFETAHAMAVHAGQKQALVAQNIANADTPGYIARDIPNFVDVYAPASQDKFSHRATRPGHLHGSVAGDVAAMVQDDKSFAAPDGNSVSIETEMLRATDAKRQHDRSLAIYRSTLTILRASLGRQ